MFYRPTPWKDPPQGLNGSDHEKTTVIFHALLPIALWEFDDSSSVYLRFGSKLLGEWQCDVGPMQKVSRYTLVFARGYTCTCTCTM